MERRNRYLLIAELAVCALLAATSIYAGVILGTHDSAYQAGRLNQEMPFFFSHSDWNWTKAWLTVPVGLIVAAIHGVSVKRWRLLVFVAIAFCVSMPVWPLVSHFSKYRHERYFDGLQEWTSSHIDADAIRGWQASLPAVQKLTSVSPQSLPAPLARLAPRFVFQLPDGDGVVFHWGRDGAWSFPRRVFVGANNDMKPPTDSGAFVYKRMPAGFWVSVAEPG